nr:MAG TPA: hypothetical protein [Caudoviricetes sp.]
MGLNKHSPISLRHLDKKPLLECSREARARM